MEVAVCFRSGLLSELPYRYSVIIEPLRASLAGKHRPVASRVTSIRAWELHLDKYGSQRHIADTFIDMRDPASLEGDLPGLRGHRTCRALWRSDHSVARLIIHTD